MGSYTNEGIRGVNKKGEKGVTQTLRSKKPGGLKKDIEGFTLRGRGSSDETLWFIEFSEQ